MAMVSPHTFDGESRLGGECHAAHGGRGGVGSYVSVHDAGHRIPYDQSEAALDLFGCWLLNGPFSL